jgi:RHS repeat-associated protein
MRLGVRGSAGFPAVRHRRALPAGRRLLAAATSGALAAGLLTATPVAAAVAVYRTLHVQKERGVTGQGQAAVKLAEPVTGRPWHPPAPVWPAAGTIEVDLPSPSARAAGAGAPARAGAMPLTIDSQLNGARPVSRVRVEMFDRGTTARAGISGLLMRLSRADGAAPPGPVRVSVDYSSFRYAFGGDWSSRLLLRVVPECALEAPQASGCAGRWLPTVNNLSTATASATVDVAPGGSTSAGGTLLALAAAASGGGGSYSATSLSPSGSWSAGGNSGDFSWSYPIRVPPAVGGPAPAIALNYSSSSVDGRMASTNNQPSWLGEGFDWQPGSIDRSYKACADDRGSGANNTEATGDMCWETDNATMTLGGHNGELIKDSANPKRWHLRDDDGTYIEHKTGAGNGDNDGEWWVATTTDGTRYWFGGTPASQSTLTEPVFGNDPGEPCHQTAFKDSSCTQAYRWQLDYVVDTHGNTMTYSYAKETNRYARNNTTTDAVRYDRAGYLTRIDYGTRTDSIGSAPMQVLFAVGDRCLGGCTTKDAAHWPDVPWDQECTAGPCEDTQTAPTFWTTKRLATITTRVWDAATAGYQNVESWTFSHSFPDPSDSITAALWLDKISHSGLVGTTTTVPDTTFSGTVLPNRVDTDNDQFPAMNKFRMHTITSETGQKTDVTYLPAQCVKGVTMPDPNALQNNTLRCFPVRWTPQGYLDPINDFFHKYPVSDVTDNDTTGGANRSITHYDYVGSPAWHYTDDDGLVKAEYKTWSVWRGYPEVWVTKGDPGEQTRMVTRYFRGMNGDHLPSGTRQVSLPAIATGNIPAAVDEDGYAGMAREQITYNGPGGAEVSATVYEPWQSSPTASRTINGVAVYARFVDTAATHTRTALDGGRAPRTTTVRSTYDSYGMPVTIDDAGDNAVADDQKCTMTDYARNNTAWIVGTVKRERVFAVNCATATAGGLTDDDVISDDRTSYDQQAYGTAPTKGDVTRVETLKAYNSGNPTYLTTATSSYDAQGRVLATTDVRGNTTTTAYTPATGGPLTATTMTSPLGWVTTSTLNPAWGLTSAVVDPNGRRTDLSYDGFGRLTSVWLPGRDKQSGQSASATYTYDLYNDKPSVVTTKTLAPDGGYVTSYAFFDSLLRPRQTQSLDAAPGGTGAVVTDTAYDSVGRVIRTHDPYVAIDGTSPVPPSTTLFQPTGTIPSQTSTVYDGAGRAIASIFQVDAAPASPGGTEKWRTTTSYGGDRTDVTPPSGGTVTSTITDEHGNTVALRQYHAGITPGYAAPASGYDLTSYTYNRKDQLARVTDAAGNHWDYTYDIRGRQYRTVDPDKGTTTTTYNDAGDVTTTTDGRGVTLGYTYDTIGRKITQRDGSITGPVRASWTYDTLSNGTVVRGQLAKSTRYVDGNAYTVENVGFTVDYRPTSVKYTIPSSENGLDGSYKYVHTYKQDGSPATTRIPTAGNLGVETLTYGYDTLGQPTTLSTSLGSTLVTGTEYTSFGELGAIHLRNNGGDLADILRTYQDGTRRLQQIWTTRATSPTTVADVRYGYDSAGNTTKIDDLTANDHQCFGNDYLGRLSQAWTPADGDCTRTPSTAGLATGSAAYWQTFSYDVTGNRVTSVDHATSTGDRTTTYTVPGGKHQVTDTSTTDNSGTTTASYTYDQIGDTRTRPGPHGTQTLTWDNEGRLASSADTSGTTTYIYDADGNRLLERDPAGATLYLPGQELRYNSSTGGRTTTRYYAHADQTVAMRTGTGVTWLSTDDQGTAQISITAVGQAVAIRRQTPFGATRDGTGTWPAGMDRGFVGGVNDATGLVHLGAREYDTLLGRFVSVDPVFDPTDPQSWNGYAYAGNAPVTDSDPDGLCRNRDGDMCIDLGSTQTGKIVRSGTDVTHADQTAYRQHLRRVLTQYNRQRAATAQYNRQRANFNRRTGEADIQAGEVQARWMREHAAEMNAKLVAIRQEQAKAAQAAEIARRAAHSSKQHHWWDHVTKPFTDHWRGIVQVAITAAVIVGSAVCVAATAGICAGAIATLAVTTAIGAAGGAATYAVSSGKHDWRGYGSAALVGGAGNAGGWAVGRATFRVLAGQRFSASSAKIVSRLWRWRYWK